MVSIVRQRILPAIVLILALTTTPSLAQAKGISGTPCAKKGATTSSAGTKYQCTKTSKGLTWAKAGTPSPASSKLKQVISVPTVKKVEVTAARISGSFSSSSKLPVELQITTPLICSVQDSAILILQTGKCSIVANQAGNDRYSPAQPVSFSFEITPPTITSDNALFDEVQTFIRIPKGTSYSSDTAEIALTALSDDATAKVCANDASNLGCMSQNGSGVADPASETRYVEFSFHVKNLDANPLPTISFQLLVNGVLSDIDSGVTLETLNSLSVGPNESADGSLYGVVPKDLKVDGAYLVIDEGITDSSIRLLLAL